MEICSIIFIVAKTCPDLFLEMSSRYDSGGRDRDREREGKVYVGDLPRDATEDELDKVFGYYGPIRSTWISKDPSGFAFVEFEEGRDAEDAIKELHGT